YIGIGEISYGGTTAFKKAELAKQILEYRFEKTGLELDEVRFDYIGINSLYKDSISSAMTAAVPCEVRLRVAGRTPVKRLAERIGEEVEALYTNGPSGGGGAEKQVKDIVSIASILIPADHFDVKVHFIEGGASHEA
ncbi:MAG: ABC transporter substrate-binding protein, partial [Lachnospiraceae bacterium]|nr:ABC transporter substrate-binding protein [Lachnospiraceae bacterium]